MIVLTTILTILDLSMKYIVDLIISIQSFESKSSEKNLKIIIYVITNIFSNVISVILINTKFRTESKMVTFFIFGQYEDITPQWINELSEDIIKSIFFSNFISMCLNYFFPIILKLFNRCFKHLPYFILKDPIKHLYDFYEIYSP